ncbi:DUF389 domain-containing protein [Nocardiopsis potens]|uniref:DUF389 domain-containing protein n=1 Tax=Nocardiopsis potens TaxID=1246458 RepID=UPI0004775516|nr:DUF389 domain-containing protein [Nocardiopsis potens]
MLSGLIGSVLPAEKLRSQREMAEELDPSSGDRSGKRSAFWTMLVLSAVIAAAGVFTDSTATVIGAMIIAPLSTPIMGIALGVVRRRRTGAAARAVVSGCLVVIGVGVLFSALVPGGYDLLSNSQVAGRTSPGVMDLVAAVATGLAGAVALSRRDVAAVLPGVAIAISLVPPLVVAGVCLGRFAGWLALGALVLFLSNLLALVFAGMVVFAAAGYGGRAGREEGAVPRRTYTVLGVLFAAVFVPLAANTAFTLMIGVWTDRAEEQAEQWLAGREGASVTRVYTASKTMHIEVRVPGEPPPVEELIARLDGRVPDGVPVVVETARGERIDAGRTGG